MVYLTMYHNWKKTMANLGVTPMAGPSIAPCTRYETTHQRSRAQAQAGIDLLWVSSLVHMVKCHDLVIGSVCQQDEGIFYSSIPAAKRVELPAGRMPLIC